jgi:2-succinyl-5-enolpyruvyl-6-hydroxy-3-cyclohexene-1-carboxylate synthase
MSVPSVGVASVAGVQAAFAATLVDEWVRCGIVHAVVCPGSRSTPLAIALAAHPTMQVHVRLDERSAGFTALGIGRALDRPALVVTTSGTAAAELHASMVEADLGGVPLIACTADRPPELRDVGAPQTIDQTHLFGRSVRWFCDPGVPSSATRPSWRSIAARSLEEAISGVGGPGPVHLNLPFREPLLGDPDAGGGMSPGRPGGLAWHAVAPGRLGPTEGEVGALCGEGLLHPARRGLIVAGAGCGHPEAVLALSAALGWPVLADPRSGTRVLRSDVISAADGILRSQRFAGANLPETVVRLGDPWVSKVVNAYVSDAISAGAWSIVVDRWGRWIDPERQVAAFVRSDPTTFCQAVAGWIEASKPDRSTGDRQGPWINGWVAAESAARTVIGGLDRGSLSEPSLARRLFARMPPGSNVVVSSSMPVRDVEAFAAPRDDPPKVLANRGANGIDGVVSTALGVALGSSVPTVALVGDLAFLHDVSALVHTGQLPAALTIVVADNGGGGIFSFLDQATELDTGSFEMLFGTPPAQDVAEVAAGFGWQVDECSADGEDSGFEDLLEARIAEGSLSVIRVRLPQRAENVVVHRQINAAIVSAVEATMG